MLSLILKITSNACLRGMKSSTGGERYAVYDFITFSCDKRDHGAYARKTYSNLIKDDGAKVKRESNSSDKTTLFRPTSDRSKLRRDFIESTIYLKFPGQGQRETPTSDANGLLILLFILGDKVNKAFRLEAIDVLERYLDGDTSMIVEILENKTMGKTKSYAKFASKVIDTSETLAARESHVMPQTSYVYAVTSDAFPGLVKIGRTDNLKARLISLNVSCAPSPHRYVAVAQTFDSERDERMAHAFFSSARKEGEFFNVTIEEVQGFFLNRITIPYNKELMA